MMLIFHLTFYCIFMQGGRGAEVAVHLLKLVTGRPAVATFAQAPGLGWFVVSPVHFVHFHAWVISPKGFGITLGIFWHTNSEIPGVASCYFLGAAL